MVTYLLNTAGADELVTELSANLLDLIALRGDQLGQALGETLHKEGQMAQVSGSMSEYQISAPGRRIEHSRHVQIDPCVE